MLWRKKAANSSLSFKDPYAPKFKDFVAGVAIPVAIGIILGSAIIGLLDIAVFAVTHLAG